MWTSQLSDRWSVGVTCVLNFRGSMVNVSTKDSIAMDSLYPFPHLFTGDVDDPQLTGCCED